MLLVPKKATGDRVTWRGREYDLRRKLDLYGLARHLGITPAINDLEDDRATQDELVAAVWRAILIGPYAARGAR